MSETVLIDGDTGEVIARDVTSGLVLSVDQWANRIRSHMIDSVAAVLRVGSDLLAAKASLSHGKFGSLVAELGMEPRKAQRFMQVATNAALANASHVSCLPPAYSTLAELARLDADVLERAIEAGEVTPDMDRKEATDLVARYKPKKNTHKKGSDVEGEGVKGDAGPDGETTPATGPLEAASSDGADSHDAGDAEPESDPVAHADGGDDGPAAASPPSALPPRKTLVAHLRVARISKDARVLVDKAEYVALLELALETNR